MLAQLNEAEAAALLGEWDDHLFALGLAAVRHVFVAGGRHLGLDDDVFFLRGPELITMLKGGNMDRKAVVQHRREAHQRATDLHPPLRIDQGRPLPSLAARYLQGVPIGPSFAGPLAPRRNLAAVLESPPQPHEILVIPALTAQAAYVLEQLQVAAVCCEHGGYLSHAALMARELQLSAIIGCRGCMDQPAGAPSVLDTRTGRLHVGTNASRPRGSIK